MSELEPIHIHIVPHHHQRYETVGDWLHTPGKYTNLYVSKLGDADFEFLVALHEMIEMRWAAKHSVTTQDADLFDQWHAQQPDNPTGEPGDDLRCPYREGHQAASCIERLVAHLLGIDWQAYERSFEALEWPKPGS